MTDIEVALTNIGEIATRDIAREERPKGLKENLNVAKRGGGVAKGAKDLYEKETKKSAISCFNSYGEIIFIPLKFFKGIFAF